MTVADINDKMTLFWAFLIGLLTAFGLMFTVWIIVHKTKYANIHEYACGRGRNKRISAAPTSENRHVRIKKYTKCKSERHKHYYCNLHRTRLKSQT